MRKFTVSTPVAPEPHRSREIVQFFDPQGNPFSFGGGGGFDPTEPIPELHFAGDPTDPTSGMNIAWDRDLWGLVFQQPAGAGDAEIYVMQDPADDPDRLEKANLTPWGLSVYDDKVSMDFGISGMRLYDYSDPGDTEYGIFAAEGRVAQYGGYGQGFVVGALSTDNMHTQNAFTTYGPVGSGAKFSISFDGTHRWHDYVNGDLPLSRTNPGELTFGDATKATGFQTRYNGPGTPSIYEYVDNTTASITLHSFDVDPNPWTVLNVLQGLLGQDRFNLYSDGSMRWGDGVAVPDVSLERGAPGNLKIGPGDSSLSLVNISDEVMTLATNAQGFFSDSDITISGQLRLQNNGDGIILHSPDGTQTKTLRLSNAGAIELV